MPTMSLTSSDLCGGFSQPYQQALNDGFSHQLLQPSATDGYLLPHPQPVPVQMQGGPVRNAQGLGGPPQQSPTLSPPSGASGNFACGQGSFIMSSGHVNQQLQSSSPPPHMDGLNGFCPGNSTPTGSWQLGKAAHPLDERNLAQCLSDRGPQQVFDEPQYGAMQIPNEPPMPTGCMQCQGNMQSKGGGKNSSAGGSKGGGRDNNSRMTGKNGSKGGGGGGGKSAGFAAGGCGMGGCGGCGGGGVGGGPGGGPGAGAGGTKGSYKVKLCTYFEQGRCNNGASCTYAHGVQELRNMGGKGGGNAMQQPSDLGSQPPRSHPGALMPGRLDRPNQQSSQQQQMAPSYMELRALAGCQAGGSGQQVMQQKQNVGVCPVATTGGTGGQGQFKTRLCTYFQQGHCSRGSSCTFAHGEHELQNSRPQAQAREPSNLGCGMANQQPNWIGNGGSGIAGGGGGGAGGLGCGAAGGGAGAGASRGSAYKVKLCTFFDQGKCTKGPTCTFAHGTEELRTQKGGGGGGGGCGGAQHNINNSHGGGVGGPGGIGLMAGIGMSNDMMNGYDAQGKGGGDMGWYPSGGSGMLRGEKPPRGQQTGGADNFQPWDGPCRQPAPPNRRAGGGGHSQGGISLSSPLGATMPAMSLNSDICAGFSQQFQQAPSDGFSHQLLQQQQSPSDGYLQQLSLHPQPMPVQMHGGQVRQGLGGPPQQQLPAISPPPPAGASGSYQPPCQGSFISCPPHIGAQPPVMDGVNGWGTSTPTGSWPLGKQTTMPMDQRDLLQCLGDRCQQQVLDEPQYGGMQIPNEPPMPTGCMQCQAMHEPSTQSRLPEPNCSDRYHSAKGNIQPKGAGKNYKGGGRDNRKMGRGED